MKDYLELGQIVNVKGLKGEVKLNSFAEDNTVFERLPKVFLKGKNQWLEKEIEKVTYNKNQVILKFKDCHSIDEAESLRNLYLYVKREDLGELPEGVYYITDLIGLAVYTDQNELLGKVDDIYSSRCQWHLCGKRRNGKTEVTSWDSRRHPKDWYWKW